MSAPGLPFKLPFGPGLEIATQLRPCALTFRIPKEPDYRVPPPETHDQWIERLRRTIQAALDEDAAPR